MGLFDPIPIADGMFYRYPTVADLARTETMDDQVAKVCELFAAIVVDDKGETIYLDAKDVSVSVPKWFVTAVVEKAMSVTADDILGPFGWQSAAMPKDGE